MTTSLRLELVTPANVHAACGLRVRPEQEQMVAPVADQDPTECGIWRLNIAAGQQGRGYGRFAVEAVCEEARRRGMRRITVCWVPDQHGPEKFYLRLGFRPTGEAIHGEIEGELLLRPSTRR